jgi:tRNA dimethylallyltransferase
VTPRRPAIIAGPTASGKSALALRVALRDGGCVINADALQVYRCWRVLTARPVDADLRRAAHALYGHVSCGRRYSVGDWLRDLAPVLDDCAARGLRPVITGGTGLYLSALTEGLAAIPPIPVAVRAESLALMQAGRLERLHAELAAGDPEGYARIDRDNPMRLQRAWEVLRATGRALSYWQRASAPPLLAPSACDCLVVAVDKLFLDRRIAFRFEKMIQHGALDECRAFLASGIPRSLPSARALGAAELFAHLDGGLGLDEATARAVVATRRFAKRQRTWLRNRMRDWTWIDPDDLDAVPAG